MLYFLSFVLSSFILIAGVAWLLTSVHRKSQFRPVERTPALPPTLKSRAVITFSMVLPFAALSFLFLSFNAMNIAQSLHSEGHYRYVVEALFLPTICFFVGYSYLRRMVCS